jgi:hypothetical protein
MKKLLLVLAFAVVTIATARAQGTINFANSTGTKVTNSLTGAAVPLNSSSFVAGLYWGAEGTAESSLALIATTTTWSPFSGVYNGGTVTFPVAGGTRITVQVRAWSAGFATYELARASNDPNVVAGFGNLQLITLGNGGVPPAPAANLVSPTVVGDTPIRGFIMTPGVVIPEPSSIAIGLLGLGAIALFRRRK